MNDLFHIRSKNFFVSDYMAKKLGQKNLLN